MGRKNFVAPFWILLVVGGLFLGWHLIIFRRLQFFSGGFRPIMLLFFTWPVITFIEAIVYWRIRRRDIYRAGAWIHVVLLTVAFCLPPLRMLIVNAVYRNYNAGYAGKGLENSFFAINIAFWVFIIMAHIFFVLVLVKCYTKRPPVEVDGENLLDDVLS